jgi:hypothetical protein
MPFYIKNLKTIIMNTETKYSVRTDNPKVLYNTIEEAQQQAVLNRMRTATRDLIYHEQHQDYCSDEWVAHLRIEAMTKSYLEDLLFQIHDAEMTDVIEWKSKQ